MTLNERMLPLVLGLVLLLAALGIIPSPTAAGLEKSASKTEEVYYNQELFQTAVNRHPTQRTTAPECRSARMILMPHHDLASEYSAAVFQKLSATPPKRVVIIGPNHPNSGTSKVHSSTLNWRAPGGLVIADQAFIQKLVEGKKVGLSDEIMKREHAAFVPIPFIKQYFPEATIVPIIISTNQTTQESFELAEALAKLVDTDTLIVGSIDFSHYLPSTFSKTKDVVTRELMQKKKYTTIAELNNDYVDSPQSLITLLKLSELLGVPKMHIIANVNSGDILHREVLSSTSYFTACFTP